MELNKLISLRRELSKSIYDYFDKNDLVKIRSDLEQSIKENNGYLFFLLLQESSLGVKKSVLDIVLDSAIFGNEKNIGAAREVLMSLRNDSQFKETLPQRFEEILSNYKIEQGSEYFYYRNIAQLFYMLGFSEMLRGFLDEYCKNSKDEDILEIYDEYVVF